MINLDVLDAIAHNSSLGGSTTVHHTDSSGSIIGSTTIGAGGISHSGGYAQGVVDMLKSTLTAASGGASGPSGQTTSGIGTTLAGTGGLGLSGFPQPGSLNLGTVIIGFLAIMLVKTFVGIFK